MTSHVMLEHAAMLCGDGLRPVLKPNVGKMGNYLNFIQLLLFKMDSVLHRGRLALPLIHLNKGTFTVPTCTCAIGLGSCPEGTV